MLHKPSPLFDSILARVSALPVIDTHEHMVGPEYCVPIKEPISALSVGYIELDLVSAGADQDTLQVLRNPDVPTEKKWPVFESIWNRIQHTVNARVTRLILQDIYGEAEMSLAALIRVREQMNSLRTDESYWRIMEEANIRMILTDPLGRPQCDFGRYLSGEQTFPDHWRVLVSLSLFHVVAHHPQSARDWEGMQQIGNWADRHITSLDEFLESVFDVLQRAKERGAVGLKDQSAYNRSLDYEMVPRSDAERIFNRMLGNPRTVFGWPESKPLDDFLFHQYMRFARELEFPVQIHTGHIARQYHRVDRANAAYLRPVLELHQQVRFDIFHGNWPYMGDLLFLARNYPNVSLNCCWLYILDPWYAEEMLQRAILTVPHSKVHGFGGDYGDRQYGDMPEYTVAHLKIARQVIASALTEMVERRWMEESEALDIAADWLYNNPNTYFGLGLEPVLGSSCV